MCKNLSKRSREKTVHCGNVKTLQCIKIAETIVQYFVDDDAFRVREKNDHDSLHFFRLTAQVPSQQINAERVTFLVVFFHDKVFSIDLCTSLCANF